MSRPDTSRKLVSLAPVISVQRVGEETNVIFKACDGTPQKAFLLGTKLSPADCEEMIEFGKPWFLAELRHAFDKIEKMVVAEAEQAEAKS